jgi:hypothetical protein
MSRPRHGRTAKESKEESHHQRESIKGSPAPRSKMGKGAATATENSKANPSKNPVDDEEGQNQKPESPETRLKAWAENRGDSLSLADWWAVKDSAETRGVALSELAELAEKNNGKWQSSAAGLKWLIKRFDAKTSEAPEEIATPEPVEICSICKGPKGKGAVVVDGRIEACECATPEWREQIAQAAARDAARRAPRPTAASEAVA